MCPPIPGYVLLFSFNKIVVQGCAINKYNKKNKGNAHHPRSKSPLPIHWATKFASWLVIGVLYLDSLRVMCESPRTWCPSFAGGSDLPSCLRLQHSLHTTHGTAPISIHASPQHLVPAFLLLASFMYPPNVDGLEGYKWGCFPHIWVHIFFVEVQCEKICS